MFADAAGTVLHSAFGPHALQVAAPELKPYSAAEKVQAEKDGLAIALERVEGAHLLPCHVKYSGPASVSELFQPQESAAANHLAIKNFEVLLHGRLLMGQQEFLSCKSQEVPLQGFVVAPYETRCTLSDLRKSLTAKNLATQIAEDECVEAEPPSTITELRPLVQFDKLCYWHQDREPNVTDDVRQSLFFLRAVAALHDYPDEYTANVDEECAK